MKVVTDYLMIDRIGGGMFTPDGQHVALDCEINGKRQHLIIAAHNAPSLGIACLAAAQICARVKHATPAEKADPEFSKKMEKELIALQTRMINEMMPPESNRKQ